MRCIRRPVFRPLGHGARAIALSLGLAASAAQAASADQAACLSPQAFAQALYERHRGFYWDQAHHDPTLFTPGFEAALRQEWAYANGEVGHFNDDPWLGAQDGEMMRPPRFLLRARHRTQATVVLVYPFQAGPGTPTQTREVRLLLRREGAGCWRLDDFITPMGRSLRALFTTPEPGSSP